MRDSDVQRLVENAKQLEDKHNVSISITEACSPEGSLKKEWRSAHLRSSSDVTPKCVCPSPPAPRALPARRPHPRSHSLGARPGQKQAAKQQSLSIPVDRSSVGHLAIEFSPHAEISTLSSILAKCEKDTTPKCSPRRICSERTSPNVSVISIPDANPLLLKVSPMLADKSSSQLVYVPSDPWTKMSENDFKPTGRLSRANHLSLDYSTTESGPWVLHDAIRDRQFSQSQRRLYRKSRSLSKQKSTFDAKRLESLPIALQISSSDILSQSKIDRFSPISCDSCWSSESCKCSKSITDNRLKNSPTAVSDNKPLEVVLSCQASPSHFYTDRMYGIGKKSPVFLKNQSRSSSINVLKCSNIDNLQPVDKLDPACLCNKIQTSISPRPSPRKLSPRINYKTLPNDNDSEFTDSKDESKESDPEKTALENSKLPKTEDIKDLRKREDPILIDDLSVPADDGVRSSEPVAVCDPLLETTC